MEWVEMKDYSEKELQPIHHFDKTPLELLDFCLICLYEDPDHKISDVLTSGPTKLSYEELIGALLHAKQAIEYSESLGGE
jgi:hypothetical protein